ncbi:MAG: lamin tail domain-containing protein [Bacteroidota bacterium]
MKSRLQSAIVITVLVSSSAWAQFPNGESFDAITAPALPAGWSSSQNRVPGTDDFTTTTSTPRSFPNAALSTNATIAQELHSHLLNFSTFAPESLAFYTRRSGTHNARLVAEASIDSGVSYPFLIGDTLRNSGSTNYVFHQFALPETLAYEGGVRIRWRVIPDPTGTTGTLRMDDVVVTALTSHDLLVQRVSFFPLAPLEGDSIQGVITIANAGLDPAQDFIVDLYHDVNRDSLPQPSEIVASATIASILQPADSIQVVLLLGVWEVGEHQVIGQAVYGSDQNLQNNIGFGLLGIGYRPQSVVVNEIMYAPASGEPEWVELYNTRSDSISLEDWLVSDNITTSKKLLTALDRRIPAGGYIILTKDSSGFVDIHPDIEAQVIHVPAFPTLNNSGDAVVVYDHRTLVMDSVVYLPSWGGNNGGKSLERIDPLGSSTAELNWGTSRSSTPGKKNSLTQKDFDLALEAIIPQPLFPVSGRALSLSVVIRNAGLAASPSLSVVLYEDVNNDSLAQQTERVDSGSISVLVPGDSLVVLIGVGNPLAGSYRFIAKTRWMEDEDSVNNEVLTTIVVGYPRGSVRVNEIMYAPPAGIPEWVELLNVSPDTISLNVWKLGNRGTSRYVLTSLPVLLAPESLAVVTKDTALLYTAYGDIPGTVIQSAALPTFLWSNTGDAVVLADNRNAVMDSIFYQPSWGGSGGTSLEVIDPLGDPQDSTNWISSADTAGATPGRKNSVVVVNVDLKLVRSTGITVLPGEPANVVATVQNAGRLPIGSFIVELFHDATGDSVVGLDELVAEVTVTQPLAYRDTLRVNLPWTNPPPGALPVFLRVHHPDDERTANNHAWVDIKVGYNERAMVINEIMYAPLSNQAEYIELLNISDRNVDVTQWQISDKPSSSGSVTTLSLGTVRRQVPPGGFLLLASDSTAFTRYPFLGEMDSSLFFIARSSWPGLNNDGDAVILRDLTNRVIDSVHFQPVWHNPGVADLSGRSLEKINPVLGSNDARAWSTCAFSIGGTPGRQNSIYTNATPASSSLSFSPNPFSPDGDGREDFTLIHYTLPINVSVIRISIYDVRGRRIRTLASNEPSGTTGNIAWDGRDDDGGKARIGMYIVLLEGVDQTGGVIETAKGVVVLAAKL